MTLIETFTHPYLPDIFIEVYAQEDEKLEGRITSFKFPLINSYTPQELSSIGTWLSQVGARVSTKYTKTGKYRKGHNSPDLKTDFFGRTQPNKTP